MSRRRAVGKWLGVAHVAWWLLVAIVFIPAAGLWWAPLFLLFPAVPAMIVWRAWRGRSGRLLIALGVLELPLVLFAAFGGAIFALLMLVLAVVAPITAGVLLSNVRHIA